MKNKKKIRITSIKDHGRNHNQFCDSVLMLRRARRCGDIEIVNHYVLGILNRFESEITYEILN